MRNTSKMAANSYFCKNNVKKLVHSINVHNFDTSMSHMLKVLIVTGATCGQEMLTLSGLPDNTPFGEFMISPIHHIFISEFVSLGTMFTG